MTSNLSSQFAAFETARQTQAQQSGVDVQNKFASLASSKLSPEAKEKKLREACEGFESIFIQKMWQEMRKSVQQSTLLHGREEQFWQDMYDQELAKKMTSAGGIGLADMMYEQLSSHLTSASRATALTAQRERAFIPAQAPLLKPEEPLEKPESLSLPAKPIPLYEEPSAQPAQEELKSELKSELTVDPRAELKATTTQEQPRKEPEKQVVGVSQPKSSAPQRRAQASGKAEIENALASMRASVATQRRIQEQNQGPLAEVNYATPHRRQQPVASGLELAKAAKRQAGDQLGSRGVREPLLPQTERARSTTMTATSRRDAGRDVSRDADFRGGKTPPLVTPSGAPVFVPLKSQNPAQVPLPYSFPRTQAQMQNDAAMLAPSNMRTAESPSSEAFVQNNPMAVTQQVGDNQGQQSNRKRGQHMAARKTRRQPANEQQIRTLSLGAPTPPSTVETPAQNAFTIPPLTATDLRQG